MAAIFIEWVLNKAGVTRAPLAAQRKIKWLGTGAEIEAPKVLKSKTPKASKGVGNGEGVSPSPADYGVWGSVVSSPNGVRGGAPAENDLYCFFGVT